MSNPQSRSTVLNTNEIRLLMEIGFMSCGSGNTVAANSIFSGLLAVRPKAPQCFIGLAMARIEAGAAQDAVSLLRSASHFPFAKTIEYKIFIALSLIAAKRRDEAERELRQLLLDSQSECAEHRLACALLTRQGIDTHVIEHPKNLMVNMSTVPFPIV
jgi:hypothetical protein